MKVIDVKRAKEHIQGNYPNDPLLRAIANGLLENMPSIDVELPLWVKCNVTGTVHQYGADPHDALVLQEDGSIHYMNLQSSTGTMFPEEGYSFCFSDGSVPDLRKLDEEYLNIGGAHG